MDLLIGTTRNTILSGNFDSGFQEIVQGHVDSIWSLAASPVTNSFLTTAHDRMIYIWDVSTKKITWSYLAEVRLTVPARVEEPVSPVRQSSSVGGTNNQPFPKMP